MSRSLAVKSVRSASPRDASLRVIYLRNGGDDSNSGESAIDAVATLQEAWSRLDGSGSDEVFQRIDATGFTGTITNQSFSIPPLGPRGLNDLGRPGALDNGNFDILNMPFELYAAPDFVRDLDVTSHTIDPITSLVILNVSDTLTVDELKGTYIKDGQFGFAPVHSNTANTVTLAGDSASLDLTIGTVSAYAQSCVLTGSGFNQFKFESEISFSGIHLTGGVWALLSSHQMLLGWNKFTSASTFLYGPSKARTSLAYSFFEDTSIQIEGQGYETYNTVMIASSIDSHGSGGSGRNELESTILDGCGSIGAGNWESAVDVEIAGCWFTNSTAYAIDITSPFNARVNNVRIDNSVGGVNIGCGGGSCKTRNVVGTGNSGYGFKLSHGAQIYYQKSIGVNTISGTDGEILCGGQEYTWAQADVAFDAGEDLDDLHINEVGTAHWSFQTNATDGWMGGFYEFDAGNDDFTTPPTWGTADKAVGAHLAIVQGAISVDEITVRVSGTSFQDDGTETLTDTEDIVIAAGAADRYFETTKKWNGQVTLTHISGTAVAWNYGWVKYWDNANRDFRVTGLESLWESDSNDSTSDIKLIHHSATGWTYQAAGGPLHSHIAQRSVDYTDNEQRVGPGAWKRTGLNIDVVGSDSEGILVHVVSGNVGIGTLSFRSLDFTADIKTGLAGLQRFQCRVGQG